MRVIFACDKEESDEYELPNDTTHDELQEEAYQWLRDNVHAFYEVLDYEEE